MRTGLLFTLSTLTSTVVTAQDNGFISGTIGFERTTSDVDGEDDAMARTINVGPVFGLNVGTKWVVGAGLLYTGTERTETVTIANGDVLIAGELKTSEDLFTVAPFVRRMAKVSDSFLLYAQLRLAAGFGKNGVQPPAFAGRRSEASVSTFHTGVGPGIVYVFSPRWAVNADWGLLGWSMRSVKPKDGPNAGDTKSSTVHATFNPGAITFGLNWLF